MGEIIAAFGNRLLIDPVPGYPARMSWRGIARDFGLKRWERPGKRLLSVSNLIQAAWLGGSEVFQRFMLCSLKRAVRLSWLRKRRTSINYVIGPQPFWREDAKRVTTALKGLGVRIRELEDPGFLRALPSRFQNHNL